MTPITQLTPHEAYERLQNGALLLDVRESDEVEEVSCNISDVIYIPMSQFQKHALSLSKDKEIITICYSGGRSYVATQILNASGYSKVSNLTGGILAWREKGFPLK